MNTFSLSVKNISRKWYLFDAEKETLGRLATKIAKILMGKDKTDFTRHLDMGDHVVVINAGKINVTGNKAQQKLYRHHSGYPGGMLVLPYSTVIKSDPKRVIVHAVSGMLPQNKLHDKMLKHLHVFPDASHPYLDQFKKS
jgi:large subunit ribosomal protein L13